MIEKERSRTKETIASSWKEMSGLTRWGNSGSKEIVALANTFCGELVELVDTLDDQKRIHFMGFFANIALVTVGMTKDFEKLNEREIKAFENLFDVLREVRNDIVKFGVTDMLFYEAYYIRDIILENAIGREDYDCKMREGMIFPNYEDLYNIVRTVVDNWGLCCNDLDFSLVFAQFKRDWHEFEMKLDNSSTRLNDRERAAKFIAIVKEYAVRNS